MSTDPNLDKELGTSSQFSALLLTRARRTESSALEIEKAIGYPHPAADLESQAESSKRKERGVLEGAKLKKLNKKKDGAGP